MYLQRKLESCQSCEEVVSWLSVSAKVDTSGDDDGAWVMSREAVRLRFRLPVLPRRASSAFQWMVETHH